jgi:hypothetical protein
MPEPVAVGLSRSDLEYELKWLLRKMPADPERALDFLTGVIVTLIDKNNAALARHLAAHSERADGEAF